MTTVLEKLLSYIKWVVSFGLSIGGAADQSAYRVRQYTGEDAWVAALSYIPFVSTGILLLRKNNSDFILDHSKQALILTIFALLALILMSSLLRIVTEVILLFLIALSAFHAFSGNKIYIPLVTEISRFIEI